MPGPAPKPADQRRRRNATLPMTQLPAKGRRGSAPKWPLPEPSDRERELWRQIWRTPQAAAWERLGWVAPVARYVKLLARVERPEVGSTALSEVRQMEDRLGLNPLAMLRLRWEVSVDEVAERRARPAANRPKVVDPNAVAGA